MALSPCKHPPLPNKPGTNYIEQTGGLPHFIDCVARAIFHTGRSQGDVSKAVQIAIGQSENWAEGKGKVSASTRAQAAAAVAQLKAQGAASKAKTAAKNLSDCGCGNLDLAQRLDEVIDLAYDEAKHPRGPGGRWLHVGAQVRVHLPNWDKPGGLVHTVTAIHGDGTATIKKPDAPSLGGGKTQRVSIEHLRPAKRPAASPESGVPAGYFRDRTGRLREKGWSTPVQKAAYDRRKAREKLPKRINRPGMTLSEDVRESIDLTIEKLAE